MSSPVPLDTAQRAALAVMFNHGEPSAVWATCAYCAGEEAFMAVTSKNLRPAERTGGTALGAQLRALTYGITLLLAVLAIYAVVGVLSRAA